MKKSLIFILSCLLLTGCGHEHTFSEATCTDIPACECGETEGEAFGHAWLDATYEEPKTCEVCGLTEGEPLEKIEVTEEPEVETPSTADGSMGELTAPEVESTDFVVEDMEPTTMYLTGNYTAKEGPDTEDFNDICDFFKGEAVSVVGVINSYKGEDCSWYRLNTGEFISADYLSTEAPIVEEAPVETPVETPAQPETPAEDPLADFSDEELQNIFEAIGGGSGGNTGSTTPDGRPFYDNSDWVGGGNGPDGSW